MPPSFFDFYEKVKKHPSGGRGANATAPPALGEPLTISQLTDLIDRALADCLPPSILVKGEVSNCKLHGASGHLYLTLKDPETCIDCVMFRSEASRLRFTPEDGMEVLVTGRIGVYGQRGRYQLYISRLEPLGQGALELAFRQLCEKLQAQGLFAPERKEPLPRYPRKLAIITSTDTAALQDMLKVLHRFPWVSVAIYNVPVQGEGAAERIAAALADLNARAADVGGIDLILLGRGGGSLEDLWEFNEEIVARAIVASRIPIITGIGHETDISIADLAADYHAHTPTEAAQVAMAHWRTVGDELQAMGIRLRREIRTRMQDARQQLVHIQHHGFFRRPMDRINVGRQMLDDRQRTLALLMSNRLRRLRERLGQDQQTLVHAAGQKLRILRDRVGRLNAALRERHPRHALQLGRQRLDGLSRRLDASMRQNIARQLRQVRALAAHLRAVGPEEVLRRGHTITTLKKGGKALRSAAELRAGDRLVTRFADGSAESVVQDQNQLSLFE